MLRWIETLPTPGIPIGHSKLAIRYSIVSICGRLKKSGRLNVRGKIKQSIAHAIFHLKDTAQSVHRYSKHVHDLIM